MVTTPASLICATHGLTARITPASKSTWSIAASFASKAQWVPPVRGHAGPPIALEGRPLSDPIDVVDERFHFVVPADIIRAAVFLDHLRQRVGAGEREAGRHALVRDELRRVVPNPAVVAVEHRDVAELRERPAQLVTRQRRAREARRPLEAGHLEEGIRQQLVAEGDAAAFRRIAAIAQRQRRLVESSPAVLLLSRAAADVGELDRRPPRQLALRADRELVNVRIDEVGIRETDSAAEKRLQPLRRSRSWRDAL